jgi:hypothetical protein
MFDKSMRKSIAPHLDAGEEPLAVVFGQGKGASGALFARAVGGVATGMSADSRHETAHGAATEAAGAVDVKLDKKMVLVITPRRMLIFKAGGAMTVKAQELITDIPIADVDSIEVGKATLTKPVTITVRGSSFDLETAKAQPAEDLPKALAQAKG